MQSNLSLSFSFHHIAHFSPIFLKAAASSHSVNEIKLFDGLSAQKQVNVPITTLSPKKQQTSLNNKK